MEVRFSVRTATRRQTRARDEYERFNQFRLEMHQGSRQWVPENELRALARRGALESFRRVDAGRRERDEE